MKDNLAIVFCITGDHAFALANVLMGLARHSPGLADRIIVFHDGVSEADQQRLNAVQPCEFRHYESAEHLVGGNCPPVSFGRIEGFRLLSEFRNVLCLDVDILIRGDISGMLNYRDSGMALCMEPGPLEFLFMPEIKDLEEAAGMDLGADFHNTGVMLLSDRLQEPGRLADWVHAMMSRRPELFLRFMDQSVLNLMIHAFRLQVTRLPPVYNKMISRDHRPFYRMSGDALIVHSITAAKFWNHWRFAEWDEAYQRWLEMGGTPHQARRSGLAGCLAARLVDKLTHLKKRTSALRHPWRGRARRQPNQKS